MSLWCKPCKDRKGEPCARPTAGADAGAASPRPEAVTAAAATEVPVAATPETRAGSGAPSPRSQPSRHSRARYAEDFMFPPPPEEGRDRSGEAQEHRLDRQHAAGVGGRGYEGGGGVRGGSGGRRRHKRAARHRATQGARATSGVSHTGPLKAPTRSAA